MTPGKVRVDKYLWSIRLYKSRSLATDACKAGNVRLNNQPLKPAHLLQGTESLTIKKSGFSFQIQVLQLLDKRVGAEIARACYEDRTPAEELNKYASWFALSRAQHEFRERGEGRPTKKDRRELDHYKSWEDLDD